MPRSLRVALITQISTLFSLDELEGLCIEMGIEFEELAGNTRIAKSRALVLYCERRDLVTDLLQNCVRHRPKGDWGFHYEKNESKQSTATLASGLGVDDKTSAKLELMAGSSELQEVDGGFRLTYPSGALRIQSPFYIRRDVDVEIAEISIVSGETIIIRGPRQVGKTSLLVRQVDRGRKLGANVVFFDLQAAGPHVTGSLDEFWRTLAEEVFDALELNLQFVEDAWHSGLPGGRKITKLFERHVLPNENRPFLLLMDEVDRILPTPFRSEFFGLLRSWHNKRASSSIWSRFNLIISLCTEPYLLIDDLNQSPFNVGHHLILKDFSKGQVMELNSIYGSPASDDEVTKIIGLLNGHPQLINLALYSLRTTAQTWQEVEMRAASLDVSLFSYHLGHLARIIAHVPGLEAALKDILHTGSCTNVQATDRLALAGVLFYDSRGGCNFRCELYRRFFSEIL